MSAEKDLVKRDVDAIAVVRTDSQSDNVSGNNIEETKEEPRRPMATKRALIAWLVLCFSVSRNYIRPTSH
jgi:hypothetical protein